MNMSTITERYSKSTITQFLVESMKGDPEIREIIVFGSLKENVKGRHVCRKMGILRIGSKKLHTI